MDPLVLRRLKEDIEVLPAGAALEAGLLTVHLGQVNEDPAGRAQLERDLEQVLHTLTPPPPLQGPASVAPCAIGLAPHPLPPRGSPSPWPTPPIVAR
jgi:hypothetical protein